MNNPLESSILQIISNLQMSARQWRAPILDHMQKNDSLAVNCLNCTGVCCTQMRNSMQVTLAEGLLLYIDLRKKNLVTEELTNKCQSIIIESRIDQSLYVKGKRLRRNYTCPLFQFHSFGCPLSMENKPFGCLAYNPTVAQEKTGDNCRSEISLLEETDIKIQSSLSQLNSLIASTLKCSEEKQTIPESILFFHSQLSKLCI